MASFRDTINSVVDFPEIFTVGKVAAVDESTYSCDVQPDDGGPLIKNVPLRVRREANKIGVTAVPAIDTPIIVLWIDPQRPTVLEAQKWVKVIIQDEGGLGIVVESAADVKLGVEGRATHPVGHGDTIYNFLVNLVTWLNDNSHGWGMPAIPAASPPDFNSDEVFTS